MLVYPNKYLKNIKEITIEMIQENNIKAIILDVDNTLIDFNKKLLEGTKEWCNNLKSQGIKFYILSNTNKKEKVEKVAKELEIPYIYFAKKPLKIGFKKIQKILEIEDPKQIAVAGDQIFTDVVGAKRARMFSILTQPLDEKDILITKIKRPIEEYIIRKYLKQQKK